MTKKKEHTADDIAVLEPVEPITSTISIVLPDIKVQEHVDREPRNKVSVEDLHPPVPASHHVLNQYGNQLVTPPRKEHVNRFLPLLAAIVATLTFAIGLVAVGVVIGINS